MRFGNRLIAYEVNSLAQSPLPIRPGVHVIIIVNKRAPKVIKKSHRFFRWLCGYANLY